MQVTLDLEHLGLIPVGVPSHFTIKVAGGDDAELAVSVQGELNANALDKDNIITTTTLILDEPITLVGLSLTYASPESHKSPPFFPPFSLF